MDGESPTPPTGTLESEPVRPPDEYESASEATRDYADMIPSQYQKKPKSKKWLFIVLAVVVLLLLAAGTYWFLLRPKPKEAIKQTATTTAETETEAPTTIPAAKNINYASSQFGLSLDYPENWKLTDTEGSGVMAIKSPSFKLSGSNGQIVITFRNKQQKLPEFDTGNAMAARTSEKIAYTKPSQSQRAQTYLSFLRYASSAGNGIDGIFITGDNGYQAGQAIPKADVLPVDPVVSVTFVKCSDESCTTNSPLSIENNLWDDKTFSDPIKNILTSLVIS
jgi:hypothetical protein